jgi:hypothetical protein
VHAGRFGAQLVPEVHDFVVVAHGHPLPA